jgi:multiple sugar transport system substrate-binding protein
MQKISRRHAVVGLGAATAASTLRPRAAKANKPVVVWWTQGFYEAENKAVIDAMAAWEKETGNKVELTIMTGSDLITKMIAAMNVKDVPDLVHSVTGDRFLVPVSAWNDKLVDMTDVIDSQKAEFDETGLASSRFYNNVTKKRTYYSVPIKSSTMNISIWRPLMNEAGFEDKDLPTTQDAYYAFFETVQTKLRAKGKRIYGLGYSMATKEADSGTLFHSFLNAYGGAGIVSPEGKLQIDDPAVRKAAITALERLTTSYKKGFVPPGAINWGDVDNNNAFFARQIVMTPNATISIPVAQMEKKDQYYKEIITQGVPLNNEGKQVPRLVGHAPCFIPVGARNVDGAKALLKAFITPANLNKYLKETRGRYLPSMPAIVKTDPYWLDPGDPHRKPAAENGMLGLTMPWWMAFNPAYGQVMSEQLWPQAEANITQRGMTPEQAFEEAAKRIKVIFSRYQIT